MRALVPITALQAPFFLSHDDAGLHAGSKRY